MNKFTRIKEVREELKLDQAEFAREIGSTQANISNAERGRNASEDLLKKIAKRYNISLNWLLNGEGPKRIEAPATDQSRAMAGPPAAVPYSEQAVMILLRMMEQTLDMVGKDNEAFRDIIRTGLDEGAIHFDVKALSATIKKNT